MTKKMTKANKLRLLIAACFSTIVLAIVNSSFGSMLEPMTEHYLSGDGASQGYPNSAMQIGCIAAVLMLMFFGGRLNTKGKVLLLVLSALIMSVGMFALGTEPSFGVFVLIFAVVGLTYGTADVMASALVADAYGDKSAGMMCLLHGSHGAAGIVAPIVVSATLAKTDRWSLPYTLIGVFVLVVAVYLAVVLTAEKKTAPTGGSAFIKFEKKLLPIALSILFYGVYLVGMICYTESYETSLITEESRGAVTLSLLYLGLTASRLVLPLLHISPRAYLRVAPVLSALVLFAGVISGNGVVYVVLMAISALVAGAFIPVAISLACELMPGRTTGASTWINLVMLLGNSVASPLIGAVSGSFGIAAAMMIPPVALLLAFAATFIPVKEK